MKSEIQTEHVHRTWFANFCFGDAPIRRTQKDTTPRAKRSERAHHGSAAGRQIHFLWTAFATRERRFCVIPRYRFRYWEPGAFSVPGPTVFRPSPWYRFRYYFLYFQV